MEMELTESKGPCSEGVIVHIKTYRRGVRASLFDLTLMQSGGSVDAEGPLTPEEELMLGITPDPLGESGYFVRPNGTEAENIDVYSEGVLLDDGSTYSVSYEESELTGLDGSTTTVTFDRGDATLVNMVRSGTVSTAMTFRPHCRTITSYQTPYMPFEVGIHCLTVDNRLVAEGVLLLDYIVEIRGGEAERCRMEITVKPAKS